MANEFVVSVANAILRDPTTLEGLMYGTTNIQSTATLNMDETQVRGGINNALLYTYKHTRSFTLNIQQATMNETILALNVGSSVLNESVTALKTDCLTLSSGSGTLTATPTGVVNVYLPNGTIENVTATGSSIFVSGGLNQMVTAIYPYSVTADRISIGTTTPPNVVDLTLIAEIRNNANVLVKYLQIHVPRFQINGNYELGLTANGVSQQTLEGMALSSSATSCTTGETYGDVYFIPVTSSTSYSVIAATPTVIDFSVAAGLPKTAQISLLGIKGGVSGTANITTSGSYAKVAGGTAAAVTVGASTGVVTAGSASGSGQTCEILCTYYDATSGSLTDLVTVNIVA